MLMGAPWERAAYASPHWTVVNRSRRQVVVLATEAALDNTILFKGVAGVVPREVLWSRLTPTQRAF